MSRILLDRPYVCPICKGKVRQLYPVTLYNHKSGHWVPVNACLPCCGAPGDDGTAVTPLGLRYKPIQR